MDRDVTDSNVYESESDTGHSEPKEDIEERPKQILFKRYYEPKFIATKVRRLKQYHKRRV
jgi:hypothetical protein